MEQIKLEYGMTVLFPCRPFSIISPEMGFGLTSSSDKSEQVLMEVSKYWESDTDPNKYKVKLVPMMDDDQKRFPCEKIYSSDLVSLINEGTVSIIKVVDNRTFDELKQEAISSEMDEWDTEQEKNERLREDNENWLLKKFGFGKKH
jgi:hypothetical protein